MTYPVRTVPNPDNIKAQLKVALHTKLTLPVQPTKVETLTSDDGEQADCIIIDFDSFTGVMPPYNAGIDVYGAGAEEYRALSQEERRRVQGRLIQLLSLPELPVRVLRITGSTVHLSRRSALWHMKPNTLRRLGVKKVEETLGRRVHGTVTVIEHDGAWLDAGGFAAWLPRGEISHDNPIPARVLRTGQAMTVQVTGIDPDAGEDEILMVSKLALLPDPWHDLGFGEGSVVRATVLNVLSNGYDYKVGFRSGVSGIARLRRPFNPPRRFSKVPVRVTGIDLKKKRIFGHIL